MTLSLISTHGETRWSSLPAGVEHHRRTLRRGALLVSWRLIPSRFAIPGSAALRTWHRSFSFANGWSRSNICRLPPQPSKRQEFGQLVEDTIRRIESTQFLPHGGIRFPHNPCSSSAYGCLCLGKQDLTEARLIRRPGAEDFGWIDELNY